MKPSLLVSRVWGLLAVKKFTNKKRYTWLNCCMNKTHIRMKKLLFTALPVFLLLGGSLGGTVGAVGKNLPYHIVATITGDNIPATDNNGAWCTDIGYFDVYNEKYYLADDNNKQIDVVDGKTNALLAPIGKGDFTGLQGCNVFDFSHEGPEGIVADSHGHLWVGNGDSTVHIYDADYGKSIAVVNTGGTARADELAYDARDNRIVVTNPDEANGQPFYTLIDATTYTVLGKYYIPGATSLEQPQWDPVGDKVYMSIPSTVDNPNGGELAVIDPTNLSDPFVKADAVGADCSPSGLALDVVRQQAALGCSGAAEILDLRTGRLLKSFPQIIDTDEVWFNAGDRRWYFGSYTFGTHQSSLGIVDAAAKRFVANIQLNDPNFHAVAADPLNNKIFVALDGKGIVVYSQEE